MLSQYIEQISPSLVLTGFDMETAKRVLKAIDDEFARMPDHLLNIERVVNISGAVRKEVNHVCCILVMERLIKMSFYPLHKDCGCNVDAGQFEMVDQVKENIDSGFYTGACPCCEEKIDHDNLTVGIEFWRLWVSVK